MEHHSDLDFNHMSKSELMAFFDSYNIKYESNLLPNDIFKKEDWFRMTHSNESLVALWEWYIIYDVPDNIEEKMNHWNTIKFYR
jgi:hypothetical protein